MPIRKQDEYVNEMLSQRGFRMEKPPEQPFKGSVGLSTAAFGESFLGKMSMATYDYFLGPKFHATEGYDVYDDIIKDDMSGWVDYLHTAQSPEEYAHRKAMVDQSIENERILSEGGWSGVGYQLMWGLADPVNFVPMMGVASRVARATKSMGATALTTGTVGAVAQGAQEIAVAQVDPNFNQDDALMAIGAVGALSAVLGPLAMRSLDPGVRDNFSASFSDMLRPDRGDIDINAFGSGTAGAAQVTDGITGESLAPLNTLGVSRIGQFIGPQTRLRASPSEAVRKFNAQINESTLMTKGNAQGQASLVPLEAEKRLYFALESNARAMTHDAYLSYRKAITGKTGNWLTNDVRDMAGLSNKSGVLTRQQFYDRVGMAMRRADKAQFNDFIDANPFIEKAAQSNRQISGIVLKEMLDSGYLKDMPDLQGTAESWFMRIYNHDKIVAEREAFEFGLSRFFIQQRDQLEGQLASRQAELKAAMDARDALRRSLNKTATTQRANEREAMRMMSRLNGKIKAHERDIARVQKNYNELEKRANAVEPMDTVQAGDYFKELMKDIRGNPLGQLESFRLLPTIRKLGGISEDKDAMGPDLLGQSTAGQNNRQDVRGILDTQARTVFRKDGKSLDYMREALAERGWLPEDSDVNDLLDLIEQDAKLTPVYDPAVLDRVIDAQSRADMIDELVLELDQRLGVSLSQIKNAKELEFYMGQLNGGEQFKEFSPSTSAQRAKYREMRLNMSRYERTLAAMNDDLDTALTDLLHLKTKLQDIRGNRASVADVLKEGRKQLSQSRRGVNEIFKDVDLIKWKRGFLDEELQGNARVTVDRILGSPMGLLEYEDVVSSARGIDPAVAGSRGNKARKLTIPDTYQWEYNGRKYSFEEFLISDPDQMMSAQMRSVVPDLLMYRRFGTIDQQHILRAVSDDYAKLEKSAKTPKEKSRLEKQKKQDLEDLRDTIAIHRGLYANRDDYFKAVPTTLRTMRQVNYLSLMGEMAIASVADIGLIVSEYGMRKVFGNVLPSFVNGLRSDLLNVAAEDARKMIIGVESVMNDRYAKIYDADVFAPAANRVEGGLNYLSGAMQRVSLMNVWLDSLRPLAAILDQDRIVMLAMKHASGQQLNKLETAEIGARFLNKDDLIIIADQFNKHGQVENGGIGGRLYVPNLKSWDVSNPLIADVQRRMRLGVAKQVDTLIIKPGTEIPKTTKKGGVVTSILQFKSFMFAAQDRILTRSAQRLALGDQRLLMGMTAMVGLGMLSYALKTTLAGREMSDKPQDWLIEGIDRSGLLAFMGEVNNITEKLTAHKIGLRAALDASPASRYVNRNMLETALGPSARIIQDFGSTSQSLSIYGDITQSELNRWRRYMPFQNALGFRYLYDGMVEGTSDMLNLPERR